MRVGLGLQFQGSLQVDEMVKQSALTQLCLKIETEKYRGRCFLKELLSPSLSVSH